MLSTAMLSTVESLARLFQPPGTVARRASLVVLHKSVGFPPGLSRREHNWLATKAEHQMEIMVFDAQNGILR